MKKYPHILSGVGALALLGGFGTATCALAQYAGNPPQYSSPAERAQTQQLNEQGVDGTTEAPAVLNGEASDAQAPQPQPTGAQNPPGYGGDAAPGDEQDAQQGTPPGEQQQQYNQQMQQYQDQQQNYQDQRAQYEDQKDRYDHNLRQYDQARWSYEYPRAYAYEYDAPRLMRLSLVAEPSQQLSDVPIEGPSGAWVGRIRNVETGPDGRPARIEIALNRRVSVWVAPGHLRFDPEERVAYTNLTREDLWNMPGATVESSPM